MSNEDKRDAATAFAIAFLEKRLGGFSGSWELIVEKGRDLLGAKAEEVVGKAKGIL